MLGWSLCLYFGPKAMGVVWLITPPSQNCNIEYHIGCGLAITLTSMLAISRDWKKSKTNSGFSRNKSFRSMTFSFPKKSKFVVNGFFLGPRCQCLC